MKTVATQLLAVQDLPGRAQFTGQKGLGFGNAKPIQGLHFERVRRPEQLSRRNAGGIAAAIRTGVIMGDDELLTALNMGVDVLAQKSGRERAQNEAVRAGIQHPLDQRMGFLPGGDDDHQKRIGMPGNAWRSFWIKSHNSTSAPCASHKIRSGLLFKSELVNSPNVGAVSTLWSPRVCNTARVASQWSATGS